MKKSLTALSLVVALACAAPAISMADDNILRTPSDSAMNMLYYQLSGEQPPINTLIENNPDYKNASEFDRDDVRKRLEADIAQQVTDMKGVDHIVLTSRYPLGEYSSDLGGFPIKKVSNDRFFVFKDHGTSFTEMRVLISNYEDFGVLKLSKEDAKALVDKIGHPRMVDAELKIKIDSAGAGRRSHHGFKVFETTMQEMTLSHRGEPITTITPDIEEKVEISKKPFDANAAHLGGIKIGMTAEDVAKVIKANGYALNGRSPVGYHDYTMAKEEGHLENNGIAPYNTESIRIAMTHTDDRRKHCSSLDKLKAEEKCLYVEFSKGEKKMFGGEESRVIKVQVRQGVAESDMDKATKSVLEAYGQEHFLQPGRVEAYAWGNGDGKSVKSYPMYLSYKIQFNANPGYAKIITLQPQP